MGRRVRTNPLCLTTQAWTTTDVPGSEVGLTAPMSLEEVRMRHAVNGLQAIYPAIRDSGLWQLP